MVRVTLEKIRHVYPGNVEAVKDVNITFDITLNSLLGPSGCGKTTLMKIIAGLLNPTEGRVYFDNEDVTSLSPQARNIAMVFQFPIVYDMSVYDNIAFPLMVRKVPTQEIRKKVLEVAGLFGLKNVLTMNAYKLDLSAKQRVAICRALVRNPNVFILDEPFTNIDPESRLALRAKLKEIQRGFNQTMIFVTHDQSEALTLSNMIAIMKDGRILQYATPEEIYENPENTFVAYFIGMPAMNLLSCSLEKGMLKLGELSFDVSNIRNILEPHGSEFIFGIRAEHIELSKVPLSSDEIPMKCVLVENLGPIKVLYLEGNGISLKVKTKVDDIVEGNTVYIKILKNKIRIFKKTGERLV
ncbi:MAG: ABC transporter ATP-binding protein [Nitrososphaerota archaeon]